MRQCDECGSILGINFHPAYCTLVRHAGVSLQIDSLIALCHQLALIPAFSKLVTDTDIEQTIVLSFCFYLIAGLGIIVQT